MPAQLYLCRPHFQFQSPHCCFISLIIFLAGRFRLDDVASSEKINAMSFEANLLDVQGKYQNDSRSFGTPEMERELMFISSASCFELQWAPTNWETGSEKYFNSRYAIFQVTLRDESNMAERNSRGENWRIFVSKLNPKNRIACTLLYRSSKVILFFLPRKDNVSGDRSFWLRPRRSLPKHTIPADSSSTHSLIKTMHPVCNIIKHAYYMPLKLTVRRRRRPPVKRRSKERGKRHSQSIYISPFTGYPDTQAGLVDSGTYSDRAPCEGWDRANTRAELVSSRSEWWIFFSLHGGGEIYFLTSPLFRISVIDASWMGEALIWWNVRKNCSTCRILLRR